MDLSDLELLSDEELVSAFQKGEESAFDQLVRRFQEKSVRLAFTFVKNWETAKEVSQNAFVKAYFGLKQFKGESKFGTWFYRILSNQAKDELRKNVRQKQVIQSEEMLMTVATGNPSPDHQLMMEEERKRLEAAVAALPEREREIFIMRYFNSLALQEIADILGVALGTVKAGLSHATQKIRDAMKLREEFKSAQQEEGGHGTL